MAFPRIKNPRLAGIHVAVYEEQSFSRAALRENTTQSGMSTQVRSLEDVLATQLLIRERKKFRLTPEGEIMYREGQMHPKVANVDGAVCARNAQSRRWFGAHRDDPCTDEVHFDPRIGSVQCGIS